MGPRKQDDLVALVIRVVYRQHALPVAWHIVGAQEKGSWIDHFCRLASASWLRPCRPRCRCLERFVTRGWAVATCGCRLWP